MFICVNKKYKHTLNWTIGSKRISNLLLYALSYFPFSELSLRNRSHLTLSLNLFLALCGFSVYFTHLNLSIKIFIMWIYLLKSIWLSAIPAISFSLGIHLNSLSLTNLKVSNPDKYIVEFMLFLTRQSLKWE